MISNQLRNEGISSRRFLKVQMAFEQFLFSLLTDFHRCDTTTLAPPIAIQQMEVSIHHHLCNSVSLPVAEDKPTTATIR